jgi:Tfp pilus assembly protein PilF
MTTSDYLSVLSIIVAVIGVLLVVFTLVEFVRLRKLRGELKQFKKDLIAENFRLQKATHRIVAAYAAKDPATQITLIKSALSCDESVFNAYNSLGYAYLAQGETLKAADAFKDAIRVHPEEKAGYCDLAFAYLQLKDRTLCLEYLREAIRVDPSAKEDILADPRFTEFHTDIR